MQIKIILAIIFILSCINFAEARLPKSQWGQFGQIVAASAGNSPQINPKMAESDPGAMDCLSDHQKQLRSVFSSSAFEEFEKDVAAAAFPQALELLVKVARRHGVNLG